MTARPGAMVLAVACSAIAFIMFMMIGALVRIAWERGDNVGCTGFGFVDVEIAN